MAGAATEILLRSMYVSRYIRLIKNRTIHRVFVDLNAVFSEIALDVRTGGTLVSNNVSVTSSETIAKYYEITGARPAVARSLAPACQSAGRLSSSISTSRPSSPE